MPPHPGQTRRWAARALVWCLATCAALIAFPAAADAHPLSTTAVLLDVGADQVTGEIQLPLDRLAIALNQPLTNAVAAEPATLAELQSYVATHLSATDPTTGTPWAVSVSNARTGVVDGIDHLVVDIAMTPPGTVGASVTLHYDGIVHRLVSHRIIVSTRPAGTDDAYTALGILDWQTQTIDMPTQGATAEQGFPAAVTLGIHHIAEGADHLLFLLMLLLPAPLLARRGRWQPADDLRRQVRRTVHVVTAFAVGHSLTLALAALGYISVPTRVVESLIAVSILVSGIHAIRPVVRGGEVWIAGSFGLMHGLAFAALLGGLDLNRTSLVTELLGFNLGIELTQLLVVALVMPSLIILSRSRTYPTVRITTATLGIVLAAGWLAQRTTLINTDPLAGITDTLVEHPIAVPAALALLASTVTAAQLRRTSRAGRAPGQVVVLHKGSRG